MDTSYIYDRNVEEFHCEPPQKWNGAWTPEEDKKLVCYIQQQGHGSWMALHQSAGARRVVISHIKVGYQERKFHPLLCNW
ncbi:hypothetical protein SUGI_0465700 [Cryptomeria japonica]|nr:hypothetical protein SUGI_0465700 [Cryptomeria japonica]